MCTKRVDDSEAQNSWRNQLLALDARRPYDRETTRMTADPTPLVLVAYASRYGSTQGVAERIAARLNQAGLRAELAPAAEIQALSGFDAVVLGSPVYDQRWLTDARELVQRELEALRSHPTWLFSVGSFGDRKRAIGSAMLREPRDIEELKRSIRPRDYRVFAGVIDPQRWPLPSRLFYRAFGGRFGDNRDWPAIDAWADDIGRALSKT